MNEDRLQKIETILAHQEQQIQDLSDGFIRQGREIDALKRRLELTTAKLSELEMAADSGDKALSVTEQAARDKPPHY